MRHLVRFDLPATRGVCSRRFTALLVFAVLFAIPASDAAADANDCPLDGKTLMLATGSNTSGGYGCGYTDEKGNHSIGALATEVWSSYPALGYKYDYVCDYNSDSKYVSMIKVKTQPQFETVDGKQVPTVAGTVTYTVTNWATDSRHWAAGVVWNTGNATQGAFGSLPAPGTPPGQGQPGYGISYTNGCGSNNPQIPSWVLNQTVFGSVIPPNGIAVDPAAGATDPADGGTAAVGASYVVNFATDLVGTDSQLPNGQQVALQYLQDAASDTWGNLGGTLTGLTHGQCVADAGNSACAIGNQTNQQQGLADSTGVAVSPDGRSVYVASTGDDAIARFDRDPTTGALTPKGCVADAGNSSCGVQQQGLADAAGVAVSPDGKSVYVASSWDDAIVRFDRDTTGALTPAGCITYATNAACGGPLQGLDGARAVAVSPDGKSVYVVSNGSDAIVRFDRDTTGALTSKGCIAEAANNACGVQAHGLADPDSGGVAVSPDGKSVYVASTGDDAIARFDRDATTGALTAKGCVADAGNSSCGVQQQGLADARGVAVSPDGKSVYVASSFDDAIVRLSRDPTTGALTPQGCIADAGNSSCGVQQQGLDGGSGVAVSPDGKSVYVASNGDYATVLFGRDTTTGALTPKGCIADAGYSSCDSSGSINQQQGLAGASRVAVSPDGKSVYVASPGDDAVVFLAGAAFPPAQFAFPAGAGVLTWKPTAAGTYTLRAVYPGFNVAAPNRGYTPAVSGVFKVTVPGTSRRASARSTRAASATAVVATASRTAKAKLAPRLETQMAGFGDIALVNSQFTVPKSGRIKPSLTRLACPKRFALLHVEATSLGKSAPAGGVTVGQSGSGRVQLKISGSARGRGAQAQLMCRRSRARHVVRKDGFAYGTTKGDRIVMALRNRTALGGLGADRLTVSGSGSSAFGGLGDDRITVRAGESHASGGPGDDTLRSTAAGRTLLSGGLGNDRLTGSRGRTIINALDGSGGDTVSCRSDKNRVVSDPGDTLIGPCTKVGPD